MSAKSIYRFSQGALQGAQPAPRRKIEYNIQSNVDHTTLYDANLLKEKVPNLSLQTDDREMQANGISAFILNKQTFNYTDFQKRPIPYLEKLRESYRMEDELESIFYSRASDQVAGGALVVENRIQ